MSKHQGQVLRDLAKTDSRGAMKIGKLMGITPSYISRLFTHEVLSKNIIDKACEILDVDKSVFYDDNAEVVPRKMSSSKYEDQIKALEESIKRLAAELEREKAMTDTMRKALDKYFDSPDT